jgi:hypothetical protein
MYKYLVHWRCTSAVPGQKYRSEATFIDVRQPINNEPRFEQIVPAIRNKVELSEYESNSLEVLAFSKL